MISKEELNALLEAAKKLEFALTRKDNDPRISYEMYGAFKDKCNPQVIIELIEELLWHRSHCECNCKDPIIGHTSICAVCARPYKNDTL